LRGVAGQDFLGGRAIVFRAGAGLGEVNNVLDVHGAFQIGSWLAGRACLDQGSICAPATGCAGCLALAAGGAVYV